MLGKHRSCSASTGRARQAERRSRQRKVERSSFPQSRTFPSRLGLEVHRGARPEAGRSGGLRRTPPGRFADREIVHPTVVAPPRPSSPYLPLSCSPGLPSSLPRLWPPVPRDGIIQPSHILRGGIGEHEARSQLRTRLLLEDLLALRRQDNSLCLLKGNDNVPMRGR